MVQTSPRKALPWAVVDGLTTAVTAAVSLVILSQILEPRDFGLVAFAQSVVATAQMFAAAGIKEAVIRARHPDMFYQDTAHWLAVALSTIAFFVCLGIAGAQWVLGHELVALVLAAQATTLLFGGFSLLPEAVLTRKMRTAALARRTMLAKVLYAGCAIGLAFAGFGVWSIVIAAILQLALSTAMLWQAQPRYPRFRFSASKARQILGFGWAISAETVLWSLTGRVFVMAVGLVHGLTVLGYVNIAMRSTEVFSALLQAINSKFAMPLFSRAQADPEKVRSVFFKATELINVAAAPVFVGLGLTAPDWVPVFLGAKWAPAVPMVQILSFVWALIFTRMLAGDCVRVMGHPRALLPPAIVAGIASIAAVFLTAGASMVAVIYAWGARTVFTLPMSLALVQRYAGIGVVEQLRPLMRPLSAVLVLAIVVLGVRSALAEAPALLRLAASIAAGGGAYLLVCFAYYGRRGGLRALGLRT